MKSIKSRVLLASAASLLVLSACNSEQNAQSAAPAAAPAVKGVAVATVNGTAINKSRVDMIIAHGASAGEVDTPEARKSIIDKLTMQTLIAEAAVKKKPG
ncbi:hypothetical protein [Candidatus Accumulibacter phosphatis]|uniref:hypothetical protein n=1 Tax=Candidatus Accumulibacter phosphatis TaxID=327160 RepID=UPI0020C16080|nr:hypothetical protein [Candidatus Accumulibacter phosphatis]